MRLRCSIWIRSTFKPKARYSGDVTIDVQAKTVDHGADDISTDVFISGLAHLNFVFDPVANDVTLAVTSPVPVFEDHVVSLSIRPTTTDTGWIRELYY